MATIRKARKSVALVAAMLPVAFASAGAQENPLAEPLASCDPYLAVVVTNMAEALRLPVVSRALTGAETRYRVMVEAEGWTEPRVVGDISADAQAALRDVATLRSRFASLLAGATPALVTVTLEGLETGRLVGSCAYGVVFGDPNNPNGTNIMLPVLPCVIEGAPDALGRKPGSRVESSLPKLILEAAETVWLPEANLGLAPYFLQPESPGKGWRIPVVADPERFGSLGDVAHYPVTEPRREPALRGSDRLTAWPNLPASSNPPSAGRARNSAAHWVRRCRTEFAQ